MGQWVLDIDVLYQLLDEKRQRDGRSWRAVATELGFGSSTFSRMAAGNAPDAHSLGVMLIWLGWAPELALLVRERPSAGEPSELGQHEEPRGAGPGG